MANTILYDNTTQTQNGANSGIEQGGFQAFSFSTGAAGGSLSDVQVELSELSPDSGSITAYLYSDNLNTTNGENTPGTQLAQLGTVSDTSLNSGTGSSGLTLADFGASNTVLAPNTRYWIKLVSTANSRVDVEFAAGDGGTGVATEYQQGSGSVAGTSDSNATDGTAVQAKVTEAVTCFAAGTRIGTVRGEIAVEELSAGDIAITASGEPRPIRWLGHRTVDCRRHPRPHEALPVRIAAHAFGENRPSRDLDVSPGHSICVDVLGEVLIPASCLINGTTIQQIEVDEVTYWHVELDSHDILLAENLPAESYLEMGNRGFFAEGGVVALDASPDAPARTHADFCRPFVDGGPVLDAVRAQLRRRAETMLGWTLAGDTHAGLHLVADGQRIEADVSASTARFVVPAGAQTVWLASDAATPRDVIAGSTDGRRLGVCVARLTVDDGLETRREVGADDERLCVGFHACEEGVRRWTAGRALLPNDLWAGCRGTFFLRIDFDRAALPRWVAPSVGAGNHDLLALAG